MGQLGLHGSERASVDAGVEARAKRRARSREGAGTDSEATRASAGTGKAEAGGSAGAAARAYGSPPGAGTRGVSRDGDVLEITHGRPENPGKAGKADKADKAEGAEGRRPEDEVRARDAEKAREWAREMTEKIAEQQRDMVRTLLGIGAGHGKREDGKEDKDGKSAAGGLEAFTQALVAQKAPEAAEEEEAVVPEYWNAENTSQRIVDFATSFISLWEGSDEEYHETMVKAVKKGFEEAAEVFGELPGPSGKLWKETEKLTFEKLDRWMEERRDPGTGAPEPTV